MPHAHFRLHIRCFPLLLVAGFGLIEKLPSAYASPQVSGNSSTQTPSTASDALAGQVVNGITGVPISRALVQVNGQGMLTDQEGRFRFEQSSQFASSMQVTKPGFSTSPEQTDGPGGIEISAGSETAALTLTLWPEALLTGTVLGPDGEPLARIGVLARRFLFDEQGEHVQVAGQKMTDSHGQFRISVPAGDYTVEAQFSPRGFERNQAVLPVTYPPSSSGSSQATIHLLSGTEQRIELRPAVSRTFVVTLPLDSEDGPPPRITARSSNGSTFPANASVSQETGSVRLNLPAGTYVLRGTRFGRDGIQFGETSVTVTNRDTSGAPLHLNALPNIPIEVIADSSVAATSPAGSGTAGSTLPNVMQLNLVLEPLDLDPTSPFQFGVRPTQQREGIVSMAAPPGIYRLAASIASGWYVKSATSRGSDLLRENLIISAGSSPSPITLVVSNQTGALQGTVKLSGTPTACWVYLVSAASAVPSVLIRKSESSGAFHLTDLPPGSYRGVAFPYRRSINLQEPEVLNQFSTYLGSVSVASGATANLDLNCVPTKELTP